LEQSGVFYEAHQDRWLAGQLDLETLRREPQARMGDAPLEEVRIEELSASQERAGPLVKGENTGAPARPPTSINLPQPLPPSMEQQLHFLISGELRWQGEAWPGQSMQWRLAQEHERGPCESASDRVWHTSLRMQLPQLGEVEAQLSVQAGDVSLRLKSDASVMARFSEALPQLGQAFDAAGVALKSAVVQPHA
jgi:hypothetical protein